MLTSKRCSNHARNAKVVLVKLPERKQLVNHSLLLRNTVHLGYESGIVSHRSDVEEASETVKQAKDDIEEQVGFDLVLARAHCRGRENGCKPVGANQE